MQVEKNHYAGLVADMLPNIRVMQFLGHFLHRFSTTPGFMKKIYSCTHLIFFFFQYVCMVLNLALNTGDVNELTSNTITVLHFTHTLTKFCYVGINLRNVYRWRIHLDAIGRRRGRRGKGFQFKWHRVNVFPSFFWSFSQKGLSTSGTRRILIHCLPNPMRDITASPWRRWESYCTLWFRPLVSQLSVCNPSMGVSWSDGILTNV